MEIDINNLLHDIDILIYKLRHCKNINEYKYIISNLYLLFVNYEILTGKQLEVPIPLIKDFDDILNRSIPDIDSFYKNEYFLNQERNSKSSIVVYNLLLNKLPNISTKESNLELLPMLKIIVEFLHDFNPDIYDVFVKLVDDKSIEISSTKFKQCETSDLFVLNKFQVFIEFVPSIEGALSFIHELGHVYAKTLLRNVSIEQSYNDINSFIEFYSSFLERMFVNYLIANNIMLDDTIKSNHNNFNILKKYAKSLSNFSVCTINDVTAEANYYLTSAMMYFWGEYLAFIKESDYMDDKIATNEQIKDFIIHQGLYSQTEELKILGVDEEELYSGNKLKRILNKHLDILNTI